jgi:hypothetical protein
MTQKNEDPSVQNKYTVSNKYKSGCFIFFNHFNMVLTKMGKRKVPKFGNYKNRIKMEDSKQTVKRPPE